MRTTIAAAILRSIGHEVEYRVQRIKQRSVDKRDITTDGVTVLRADSYKEAKAKYRNMRMADTDTVVIRVVAIVNRKAGDNNA